MPAPSRYHRQALVLGDAAQARLETSHAAIVGLGALGCHSADLLARAGVGTLTIIDRDLVELTNLQRQPLYSERDAAEALPKAAAAERRLREVNSSITIRSHIADVTARNVETLVEGADILLDGTDNFETRFLLNDVAAKRRIPFCYAGVIAARGMQMTVLPERTPCLRCVFEELPAPGSTPTCDTAGVLGPAVSIVAGAQAMDAIKILSGREDLLSHSLLEFDLWENTRRRIDLKAIGRREGCPCCGLRRFDFLERSSADVPASLCGQNAVQVVPASAHLDSIVSLNLAEISRRWGSLGDVSVTPFMARVRPTGEALELTLFADGRAIVRGTTSTAVARSLYAKLVGS